MDGGAAVFFFEGVVVFPEAVGAFELYIDEGAGRVPLRDFGGPADGDAAEAEAVVNQAAFAHGDGLWGDDVEVDPRRGDLLEIVGVGKEGEEVSAFSWEPELGFQAEGAFLEATKRDGCGWRHGILA